ncbi:substrate-binding periplasmic protein [Colwellia sp. 12G3]|uniref:substrate-binding periplasmic protein n=1 Tax=Colwellia sp. 12G3 TaxID=2058299 RepID=UPI0012FF10CF|nr:transporter substrate-binding domain-containing protein [Colwellia sp. 12G3]
MFIKELNKKSKPDLFTSNWLKISLRNRWSHLILILMLTFPSSASFSQAEKIKIAIGDDLAPWIFGNGQSGILIDLVRDCLKPANSTLEFIAYPYGRRLMAYKKMDVDAVIDINTKTISSEQLVGFFTGNLYAYENFAFSLSENNFSVINITDLEKYSLLSWQGAINHLDGEYADMARGNPNYAETSRQSNQVSMLFRKRVDFIQLDYQIYNYYKTKLIEANEIDSKLDVTSFALFGKSPNGLMFRDKELRDICRNELEKIEMKIKYKEISP